MPFDVARTNLCELLTNLSFVKVVAIQKNGTAYTGEAVELFPPKRLAFFDKFGRTRGFLSVGPMTLTQAPMGFDHPSSVPSVGEVLVGTLVPNARKSHLSMVLRGWSSDAKCLSELYRLVKFGTKKSELENRSLLLQPAGFLPEFRPYKHEVYMVARMILWSNLRPLQVLASKQGLVLKKPATEAELDVETYISIPALQFAQLVSIKLEDPEVLETFMEAFEHVPTVPPPANPYESFAKVYSPKSPEYLPEGYGATATATSATSAGSSPYNPTSPVYAPYSPSNSPSNSPSKPANLTSPPSSPKYSFD